MAAKERIKDVNENSGFVKKTLNRAFRPVFLDVAKKMVAQFDTAKSVRGVTWHNEVTTKDSRISIIARGFYKRGRSRRTPVAPNVDVEDTMVLSGILRKSFNNIHFSREMNREAMDSLKRAWKIEFNHHFNAKLTRVDMSRISSGLTQKISMYTEFQHKPHTFLPLGFSRRYKNTISMVKQSLMVDAQAKGYSI